MIEIHLGDNLPILRAMPDATFDLVYVDPPFNTGRTRLRTTIRTVRDAAGDRTGFGGRRYRTETLGAHSFGDAYGDFMGFLEPRLVEARRLLRPDGSLFVHLDCREVHYCKVALDRLFGRASFMNEIIWAYDYGGRGRNRWPAKHDTILWYAVDPGRYTFNFDEIDRIPYLAPGLAGAAKAARGKVPTDVWWMTIVSPTGREKTGYPAQKPLRLVERIVRVHSRPGARLLDFFAGSGTLGEAALNLGRDAVLVDSNPRAIEVMARRLAPACPVVYGAAAAQGAATPAAE
jgi:site-specific DNA-methyltransferase (adenine-specific)